MLRRSLLLISWLLLAPLASAADSALQRLERFLDRVETLQGAIIQTVLNPKGELQEESRGELKIRRPHRFYLHYNEPYDLLYVADGRDMWVYDRDLAQVTVKPQGDALDSTPALFLSGDAPLGEKFRIEEIGEQEGFWWLNLYPKAADASFDYIRIAMEGETLRAMEMVDGFGQTTRLLFETITRNQPVDNNLFHFTPPAGIDVIGKPGEANPPSGAKKSNEAGKP